MVEYENRYGDVFTFTKQEDGNILWEGNFKHHRIGFEKDNPKVINFVDPSGGPFIQKDKMLSHIVWDDSFNVIIEGFESVDGGYIIKTKEHKYDPNDMSHLADLNIIGGIINTTEK
jgi:hypothetical protein